MSSIGLADEVLYFFLVESGDRLRGRVADRRARRGRRRLGRCFRRLATPAAWAQAAATVAAFLPAMAIVGAIVPVHRLLQQRPVALLAD